MEGIPLTVREATLADAPALARLVGALDHTDVDPTCLSRRLQAVRAAETVLVAECPAPVGFCSVHWRPWLTADHPYAELTELYVCPQWRRRGVATALVRRGEELARRRGARDLVLLTGFGNAEAQAFYRALGYSDYCLAMRKRPL